MIISIELLLPSRLVHAQNLTIGALEQAVNMSGVFIANFEHISRLLLVFLLLTLIRQMPTGLKER